MDLIESVLLILIIKFNVYIFVGNYFGRQILESMMININQNRKINKFCTFYNS